MARLIKDNPDAEERYKIKAQHFLGKLSFDNKDYGSALLAFEEVSSKDNGEDGAEAQYLIAEIYYKQGQLDKATNQLNSIFNSNSAYYYYIENALLLTADIEIDKGEYYMAEGALQALIDNYTEGESDLQIYEQAQEKLILVQRKIQENSRVDDSNEFEDYDEDQN